MKLITHITILACTALVGCVAQVGDPEQQPTGTQQSTLDKGAATGGGPSKENGPSLINADPGAAGQVESGDNEGPQPVPWKTMSEGVPPDPSDPVQKSEMIRK